MAELTTKFAVGDSVFKAWTTTQSFRRDCPDCNGTRKWEAVSPAGKRYEFSCPRCSERYRSDDALSLDYTQYVAAVQPLTIGSIRIDTADDRHKVSYMCRETGVGSGTIHYEEDLFATRDEAQAAAENKANAANLSTPWVVKQFDKSLSLSDYQLSDASLKGARDTKYRHEAALMTLFEDLRGCETIDQVKETIDGFSLREAA